MLEMTVFYKWGNEAVYRLVGCIITLKLYYVQLLLCAMTQWSTVGGFHFWTLGAEQKVKLKN